MVFRIFDGYIAELHLLMVNTMTLQILVSLIDNGVWIPKEY